MNGTKVTINSVKGTSTLVRPRFGPGMLLQHEDLEQLSAYTRELSRLMFRSLFGCGVVCGLVVTTERKYGKVIVTVSSGLALDCAGDPIYLPKDQPIPIDEECIPNPPPPLWVIVCSYVKCCAPRTPACASDEEESPSVCTRERDGFEIRIVSELPKCACHCERTNYYGEHRNDDCKCADPNDPCYHEHYAGKCGCHAGEECDCSCDCILLARLDKPKDSEQWTADPRVRRFVRPVLMRDPLAETPKEAEPEPTPEAEEPAKRAKATKVKQQA
jgi:hypothetical protein